MFRSISPEKAREGLEAVDYILNWIGETALIGSGIVLKAEGAEEAEAVKQLADILRFYGSIEVQLEKDLAPVLTTKVVGNEIIVTKGLDKVAKLPKNIDAYTKEIDKIVLDVGKELEKSKATKEMIDAIEVSFGKAFSSGVAQGVEIGIAEQFLDDVAELKRKLGRRPAMTAALKEQMDYAYAVQGHYVDSLEPKMRKTVAKELEKVSERWKASAADRIRVINGDTVRSIQDKLKFAELNGQSLPQTAKSIMDDLVEDTVTKKKIPRYAKAMRNRANMIAKTETHRARQSAVVALGKAEGKKLWTWISMYDGKVCTICAPRHNKTKFIENWADIPPSHPRCRCMLVPGRSDPHFGAKGRPGDDGISLISRAVPVEPVNLRPPSVSIPSKLRPKPPIEPKKPIVNLSNSEIDNYKKFHENLTDMQLKETSPTDIGSDTVKNITKRLQNHPDYEDFKYFMDQFPEHVSVYGGESSRVNAIVGLWNGTSADNNKLSLFMQEMAREEFKLEGAALDHLKAAKRWGEVESLLKGGDTVRIKKGAKVFLREMYNETQEFLKKNRIKELPVFRGVSISVDDFVRWGGKLPGADEYPPVLSDILNIDLQPMSSFSTSFNTAYKLGLFHKW